MSANTLYKQLKAAGGIEIGSNAASLTTTAAVLQNAPPGYLATGTATFTNADATVSAVSVDLRNSMVHPTWNMFDSETGGHTASGTIGSITNASSLELAANWSGTGGTLTFWVVPPGSYRWVILGGSITTSTGGQVDLQSFDGSAATVEFSHWFNANGGIVNVIPFKCEPGEIIRWVSDNGSGIEASIQLWIRSERV